MSIVTTVTLIVGLTDEEIVNDRINASLGAIGVPPLACVSSKNCGGDKAPQNCLYRAAYSHHYGLDVAVLGKMMASLPWEQPECAILIVQPEDGPASVYRPPVTEKWFWDVGPKEREKWLEERRLAHRTELP